MHLILRSVIATLAFGLFLAPFASAAQQSAKIPRIGFLAPGPAPASGPAAPRLRQGLADLGYVEGRDIVFEARFAEGRVEQLPELAAELVRLNVDVIAVIGAVTARAAMKATINIPIVFVIVVDPVTDNVIASMERPGGNVTGLTSFDPQQPRKQLELFKEAFPEIKRVAIFGDRGVSDALSKANEEQARASGLHPLGYKLAGPTPDIEGAFAVAKKEGAESVLLLEEPIVFSNRRKIAQVAATNRLPTMVPGDWADVGGMIAYGTSLLEGMGRMSVYVDKILKGAKPGDLPVEVLTRYRLTINLKTAREIGVSIPPEVLKRADKVIE